MVIKQTADKLKNNFLCARKKKFTEVGESAFCSNQVQFGKGKIDDLSLVFNCSSKWME